MLPQELLTLPLFTTVEAHRVGVSDADLRVALKGQAIRRLKRGWYTAQPINWPEDRHRLMVQVELRERTGVVPSHYSAAVHLQLPVHRVHWGVVHLMRTTPGPGQHRAGLSLHKKVGDYTSLDPALAIAQMALLSAESGLMAYDAALRRGLLVPDDLEQALHALRKWPGYGQAEQVRRLGDGRRESPLESRTALTFDRWGWHLIPQFTVPGTRYRADGLIEGTSVLIETDGRAKYDEDGALINEKVREDDLRNLGWEVVRVTDELLGTLKVLHARVTAALDRAVRRGASAA